MLLMTDNKLIEHTNPIQCWFLFINIKDRDGHNSNKPGTLKYGLGEQINCIKSMYLKIKK